MLGSSFYLKFHVFTDISFLSVCTCRETPTKIMQGKNCSISKSCVMDHIIRLKNNTRNSILF